MSQTRDNKTTSGAELVQKKAKASTEWKPKGTGNTSMTQMVQMRLAHRIKGTTVLSQGAAVQAKEGQQGPTSRASGPEVAREGVAGASSSIPHRDAIQKAFGKHDVSSIVAKVGGSAAKAGRQLGAQAYATGNAIGFSEAPDLHTAAHEAAHIVQQRAGISLPGGMGSAGDKYEVHADAVADKVVRGESAEALLDEMVGGSAGGQVVQRVATKSDFAQGNLSTISADRAAIGSTLAAHGKDTPLAQAPVVTPDTEGEHKPDQFTQAADETVNAEDKAAVASTGEKIDEPSAGETGDFMSSGSPQVQCLALFDPFVMDFPTAPDAKVVQTQAVPTPAEHLLGGDVARGKDGKTDPSNPYYQVAFQNPIGTAWVNELDTLLTDLELKVMDLDDIATTLDQDILLVEGTIRDELMEAARAELKENKEFVISMLGDIRGSIDDVRREKRRLKTEIPQMFSAVEAKLQQAATTSKKNEALLKQETDQEKLDELKADISSGAKTTSGALGVLFKVAVAAGKSGGSPGSAFLTDGGKLALGVTVSALYSIWTAPQREALTAALEGHKAEIKSLRQSEAAQLVQEANAFKTLTETTRDNILASIGDSVASISATLKQLSRPDLKSIPETSKVFAALTQGIDSANQQGAQLTSQAGAVDGSAVISKGTFIENRAKDAESEIERRRIKKHSMWNHKKIDSNPAKQKWSKANKAILSFASDAVWVAEEADYHASAKAGIIQRAEHLETFEQLGNEVSDLVAGHLPEDWLTVLFGAL